MKNIKIIAEIANAHQGNEQILQTLIRCAAEAGADGIKFQWFKYDNISVPEYRFYPVYEKLFIPEHTWESMLELALSMSSMTGV